MNKTKFTGLFLRSFVPKQWSGLFFFISFCTIGSIASINIIINPYGIFSHTHSLNSISRHLLPDRITHFYNTKRIKPDVVMMGTSRIGLYPPAQVAPYLKGTIYNATLAGSTILEQASYLEFFITSFKPSTIIWSLDFFSFNPEKQPYQSFSQKRLLSKVFLDDYMEAIFSFKTLSKSIKTAKESLSNKPHTEADQPFTPEQVASNIAYTLNQYATQKDFLNAESFKHPHAIDQNLARVAHIVNLAKQHNITLIIYLSPVYFTHLEMIETVGLGHTYAYWKSALATIHPYYNFATINTITQEPMNFRDSSHTIGSIGKLVFGRIFNNTTLDIPNNFGILVDEISHMEQ